MARAILRRTLRGLHRKRPDQHAQPGTGPRWQAVPGGVVGCRFCAALRELFTFEGIADFPRYQRLFSEGECAIAMPGPRFERIEAGEEFSLFRMVRCADGQRPDSAHTAWFRNEDMTMAGSNRPPKARR